MRGTLTTAGFTIPTGQDRILDNYNNDETPTFHWFVGVLLSLASQDRSSRNFAFSR